MAAPVVGSERLEARLVDDRSGFVLYYDPDLRFSFNPVRPHCFATIFGGRRGQSPGDSSHGDKYVSDDKRPAHERYVARVDRTSRAITKSSIDQSSSRPYANKYVAREHSVVCDVPAIAVRLQHLDRGTVES